MSRTTLGHVLPSGGRVLKRYPGATWLHKDRALDADHPADQHYDGRPRREWVCQVCDEPVVLP